MSNERHPICRAFRQGQTKAVMVIRPFVVNSAIDREIAKRRMAKLDVKNDLTKAFMHTQRTGPPRVELEIRQRHMIHGESEQAWSRHWNSETQL